LLNLLVALIDGLEERGFFGEVVVNGFFAVEVKLGDVRVGRVEFSGEVVGKLCFLSERCLKGGDLLLVGDKF
jgi:hypothetical protein